MLNIALNIAPHILPLIQVISGGAAEKLLDELFSSTPARLVFIVMIIAVVSIPIMLFFFLVILNRSLRAAASNQSELLAVIKNYQTFLNTAQENNNENYLMVKEYVKRLENMYTMVGGAITATQTALTNNVNAVADLLLKTTTLHAETRKDIQTTFSVQLGAALEDMLDQRRLDIFEEFQAPAEDDCRFKIRLVRAAPIPGAEQDNPETVKDILLYKAPIFKNGNEAGRLRGSGEVVKLITDTVFPGWAYVKQIYGKSSDGQDDRIGGYVRVKSLSIIDLPDVPINVVN